MIRVRYRVRTLTVNRISRITDRRPRCDVLSWWRYRAPCKPRANADSFHIPHGARTSESEAVHRGTPDKQHTARPRRLAGL